MERQPTDASERLECTRVGLHNCAGGWRNHDRAEDVPIEFNISPTSRTLINLANRQRTIE